MLLMAKAEISDASSSKMDTSGLLHMPAGTPQYGVSEDAYSQRVLAPLLALNARAGVFPLL